MRLPANDTSYDDEYMDALVRDRQHKKQKPNPVLNCICTGFAFITFFWIHHRTEFILSMVLFCSVSLAVTGVIETYESGHKHHHHTIENDYSGITSALELKLGTIDHWCLDGTDKHCPRCDDPTKKISRMDLGWWGDVFMRNTRLATTYLTNHGSDIDVIFLGDSNTEGSAGTFKGGDGTGDDNKDKVGEVKRGKLEEALVKSKKKFEKYFDKSSGGLYGGIALGIAGDTSPNLLWRIIQNEMADLKPNVWWINIGINDILSTNCSEEIALMGILRVVEELMARDDGASIVINSILPVATRKSMSLEGKHIRNKYWVAIKLVNERLKIFSKKHPGVKFFDATDLLTELRGGNRYMLKEMFTDKVHLSPEGHEMLAIAQVDVITSIYKKREEMQNAASGLTGSGPGEGLSTDTVTDDHYYYTLEDHTDDWLSW